MSTGLQNETTDGVVHGRNVQLAAERITIGSRPPQTPSVPEVKLNRDGQTIVSIELTCTCGQTHVLECDYD